MIYECRLCFLSTNWDHQAIREAISRLRVRCERLEKPDELLLADQQGNFWFRQSLTDRERES